MAEMQTGDISRRLGIPVTEALLAEWGFKPVRTDKRARFYDETDYRAMCLQAADWIKGRADVPMQPRPPKPEKKDKTPAASNKPATSVSATNSDAGTVYDDDEEI